ncbi:MAG: Sir2 family NAD-dependent protein deacetylase [Thermoguttaceae bacterium]
MSIAASWLRLAREVVVFTGAGVSAESGIPTFRDDDGFWRHFPVEEFATWKGLVGTAIRQPRRLADFVHAVLQPIAAAKPNPGHRAIADLEKHVGVTVVTQNIDSLHQEAGSTIVHEVHGSLFEVVTRRGRFVRLLSRRELLRTADRLDRARQGWLVLPRILLAIRPLAGVGLRGLHLPRVVLFGDAMAEPAWTKALAAARRCDCVVQVGTSGTVMPAAMLPMEAKAAGAKVITIDPSGVEGDVWIQGMAATALPRLLEAAFG